MNFNPDDLGMIFKLLNDSAEHSGLKDRLNKYLPSMASSSNPRHLLEDPENNALKLLRQMDYSNPGISDPLAGLRDIGDEENQKLHLENQKLHLENQKLHHQGDYNARKKKNMAWVGTLSPETMRGMYSIQLMNNKIDNSKMNPRENIKLNTELLQLDHLIERCSDKISFYSKLAKRYWWFNVASQVLLVCVIGFLIYWIGFKEDPEKILGLIFAGAMLTLKILEIWFKFDKKSNKYSQMLKDVTFIKAEATDNKEIFNSCLQVKTFVILSNKSLNNIEDREKSKINI